MNLFETPPGFDDPLGMLLGCHRRIEKQLKTLKRLSAHLSERDVDPEASAAAQAILRYFVKAAPHHHEDEEDDLFPLLEKRIADAAELERYLAVRERLLEDHRGMEKLWARIRKPLEGIAEGLPRTLPDADIEAFIAIYGRHIETEETFLAPLAGRWLSHADREAIGRSMAARRGADYPL